MSLQTGTWGIDPESSLLDELTSQIVYGCLFVFAYILSLECNLNVVVKLFI